MKLNGPELTIKDGRNQNASFVWVPKNKSKQSFQNSKEWVDCCVRTNGSAKNIADHLFCFYRDEAVEAAKYRGVPICTPMTDIQYAALIKDGKINRTQQEQISRHLRHHLGKDFLPTRNSVLMLCEGHPDVMAYSNIVQDNAKRKFKEKKVPRKDEKERNKMETLRA